MPEQPWRFITGDCLAVMGEMADDSVDLVVTSPPYLNQRLYGDLGFKMTRTEYVDWIVACCLEMVRVCKGLCCVVIDGPTKKFQWTATPFLIGAALDAEEKIVQRRPLFYHRVGVPGSGGPDDLRSDVEFILRFTKKAAKLPWSDNTAMGALCKYPPGGDMSNRHQDGRRRNAKTGNRLGKMRRMIEEHGAEPKVAAAIESMPPGAKLHTKNNGKNMRVQCYIPPAKANPGNLIRCTVGGGLMGHKLAHENEAPFPLKLADFLIRTWCPPDGLVLDPFSGSGTTVHAAVAAGRRGVGIEARQSQNDVATKRMEDVTNKKDQAA